MPPISPSKTRSAAVQRKSHKPIIAIAMNSGHDTGRISRDESRSVEYGSQPATYLRLNFTTARNYAVEID